MPSISGIGALFIQESTLEVSSLVLMFEKPCTNCCCYWPVASHDSFFCFFSYFRWPREPNKEPITRGRAAAAPPDPMSHSGKVPEQSYPPLSARIHLALCGFFHCVHTLDLSRLCFTNTVFLALLGKPKQRQSFNPPAPSPPKKVTVTAPYNPERLIYESIQL